MPDATPSLETAPQVFGRWTVVDCTGNTWLVRCACGTERWISKHLLCGGYTKSCGCRRRGSKRLREGTAARVEKIYKITKEDLEVGRHLYPIADVNRPKTRGDCVNGPRPCGFVSCKWHLSIDVTPAGSIVHNFPDKELDELEETCALDVADRGPRECAHVGRLLNVSRSRADQLERRALRLIEPLLEARNA